MPNVPVPRTWVDQDAATAPVLNTEIRDVLNFMLAPPRLVITRVATWGLVTEAAVPWDTEVLDTYGMWAPAAPTRITVQVPGKYRVSLIGAFGPPASGTPGGVRVLRVRLNGGTPNYRVASCGVTSSPSSDTMANSSLTLPYTFAIGEYFEILASHSQGTGVSLNFSGNSDSYCTVEWMGS